MPEYIQRLRDGVRRNLPRPFRFVVFSDRDLKIDGVETLPLDPRMFRWNLQKMVMYSPEAGLAGKVLALDLDVVVTGPLNDLITYKAPFITCEAAYKKNWCGGSVIGFRPPYGQDEFWKPLEEDREFWEYYSRGSERCYYNMRFSCMQKPPKFWQDRFPGQIVSYKVDCENGLPEGARIVRFHGKPRPHQVNDLWVKEHWRKGE
jgi:hypothetical protein